jgi:hypothetical protein
MGSLIVATHVRIRLVAYADDLAITRAGGGKLRFQLGGIGLALAPVLTEEGHATDTQLLTAIQAIEAPAAILHLLEPLVTEEREEAARRAAARDGNISRPLNHEDPRAAG